MPAGGVRAQPRPQFQPRRIYRPVIAQSLPEVIIFSTVDELLPNDAKSVFKNAI